jgi:uncharacterized protein
VELPLFPIGEVVLLPGMALPIFVFEPRYRELLKRVRATGEPFGIPYLLPVAADRDPRAMPLAERLAKVGSFAHLAEAEVRPDGTANILVGGGERYRIGQIETERYPYAVAEVEPWPLLPSNPAWVATIAREVTERFLRQVEARLGDLRPYLPKEALLQASFITANLRLAGPQSQEILEATSLLERFERLAALLGRDIRQLN